jgi:hypothetical protein
MKRRIHSDRTTLIGVLFFLILAASFFFSVIYKMGENIFVTQHIESVEDSANRLGDHVAGILDKGVSSVLDYYARNIQENIDSGSLDTSEIMRDAFFPVVAVWLHDGNGNLREKWLSPAIGEKLRESFPEQYLLGRPLPEVLSLSGNVYLSFQRKLESDSGEMMVGGLAVLDGSPILSSLKISPDALLFIRGNRVYPLMGVTGRGECVPCHLGKKYRDVFPMPHAGFIKGRGLFLSGEAQGHRFVIDPVDAGGSDDSYLLLRFPSEGMITSLIAFRRLIVPTWLLLSVVIVLGTVLLYRRLRDPVRDIVSPAGDPSGSGEPAVTRGEAKPLLYDQGEVTARTDASPGPPIAGGDKKPEPGLNGIDHEKIREDTLLKIKELSEFLNSVNRMTYPERLGDAIVWNLMNLIPGDLIMLAVMGAEGIVGEFDVFSAQRFRKDSVSEIFIKKMHKEFPAYARGIVHVRVVDVGEDSFFARYSLYKHGLKKTLLLPVEIRGVILGVVAIFRKGNDPFSSFEVSLATLLARHLGTVIENSKLHEEVKSNYFNTLRAVIIAVESKDRYRKGHSERVTEIALSIGDKIGLSKRRRNILFQAAILHDIGKITIDPAVLSKKGKLSEEEIGLIRQHPIIGYRIIEPLSFLREVKACVSEHHERYNGGGYPSGTKKEELTLEGRILAVADAFDSMTSDRPYRKALTDKEAISELERNAGGQFDPHVVKLLIEVYREREARKLSHLSGKESS